MSTMRATLGRFLAERRQAKSAEPGDADDLPDEAERRLASAHAADRVEAVEEIDPYGTGLDRLVSLLQRDPSPNVRSAAAAQLEGAEGYVAVRALVGALHDPSPGVIVSALESLELIGDATLVPMLTPLLQHRDDQVRAAADGTIATLP